MKDKIKNFFKENIKYILALIIFIIIMNFPLPYYIMAPGGIIDISDRIEVENKQEREGTLNLLSVSEYEANVATMLMSFLFKNWDAERVEESQVSNESMEEIFLRNKVMLDNSIQNAIFVAYNSANKNIDIKGRENYVIATTLDNGIKVGDKIISANGIEIENVDMLKEIINKSSDYITLKVLRGDEELTLNVKVEEEDGNKIIGILVITNYTYDLDPELKLTFKDSEGGSSGGLMISLNIYNALTNGDITKGKKIAGTGTIDINGNVGAIDGVKYKIMGAYANHMEIVFVPLENYEEAVKVKEDNTDQKIYKIPSVGSVVIGDDVEIGANTCIDKGTIENTVIGEQTKIDNLVQIGHNCKIGKGCMIVSQVGIAGSCKIGDRVVIAGQVGMADHIEIGSDTIIMAQAGVTRSFPEKQILIGAPAMPRKDFIKQMKTMKKAEDLVNKFKQYEHLLKD